MSVQRAALPAWLQQPPSRTFLIVSWVSIILLAWAYISHLGVLLIDPRTDEMRRALVTLEMMNSGNYLVPTLNGEPFLNKPPLYNWILVGMFKWMGVTPFALRLPVIIFTFFYGWLIWWFTRRYTTPRIALLTTLFFLTNGRILIYDSLQGLIDVAFSSLVFLCFMWVYHFGKKEKYWLLFLITYGVVAISFLMKGLPALAFHAFSLLGFFILQKKFRVLFSPAHFAGIGLFLAMVGGYYLLYFEVSGVTAAQMFGNMVVENTKRTVVESDTALAIRHFLTYPISLVYHFAPWALLMLGLLRKQLPAVIRQNEFITYCSVIFIPGFVIYWFSPNIDTAARYFFMLLPLLYVVIVYLYHHASTPAWQRKVFDYTLISIFALAAPGCLVIPFLKETAHLAAIWPKTIFLVLSIGGATWFAWRQPPQRLVWLVLALVCIRIGFNWTVVENRGGYARAQKAEFDTVMDKLADRPLAIQRHAYVGNTDGFSFHYLMKTGKILPVADSTLPAHCYLTDDTSAAKYPHQVIYRWNGYLAPDLWLVERR